MLTQKIFLDPPKRITLLFLSIYLPAQPRVSEVQESLLKLSAPVLISIGKSAGLIIIKKATGSPVNDKQPGASNQL